MARAAMPKKKKARAVRTPKFVDEKYTGPEPEWDNAENWSGKKYYNERVRVGNYYNYFYTAKDGKPWVISWMRDNGYSKEDITVVRTTPDSWIPIIVCGYCRALSRGMPVNHKGVNNHLKTLVAGPDSMVDADKYVKQKLAEIIERGKSVKQEKVVEEKKKPDVPRPSIQQLTREKAAEMASEIDEFVDEFDYKKATLKTFEPLKILRKNETKPLHASAIMGMYKGAYDEINELVNPPKRMSAAKKEDYDQLKEGYNHLKKADITAIHKMYEMILEACEMIIAEGKANRKPRKKKPVSKEKLVAKFKYCEKHDDTKLVSVKPIDLLGAVAALVYNTKTRKLGIYVAEDGAGFNVKGTTLLGFDEKKSVQKTLRKPKDQLPEFKKIAKRSLMPKFESIKSVETKLNGRFNDQIVIIKVF